MKPSRMWGWIAVIATGIHIYLSMTGKRRY